MEMPDEVKWLLPIVVGESWPEGDEDRLRQLRDAWHQAAQAIPGVSGTANQGAQEALENWDGAAAQAFGELWKKFVDGDGAYFTSLAQACQALGDSAEATALDVEYTKYMIIASLIMLAISIAAMIATAWCTFGASTAGIVPAQLATRTVVQRLFQQLIEKLIQQGFKKLATEIVKRVLKKVAKEVVQNVAMNVAMDVGIQGIQMLSGDRKNWDWSKTTDAAVGGAVDGVVGAASAAIPKNVTRGVGDSLGKHFVDSAVRGGVRGAAEGVASTVGQAAVTGDLGNLSAKDILTGASSGAIQGGADRAKEGISPGHGTGAKPVPDEAARGLSPGPSRLSSVLDTATLDTTTESSAVATPDLDRSTGGSRSASPTPDAGPTAGFQGAASAGSGNSSAGAGRTGAPAASNSGATSGSPNAGFRPAASGVDSARSGPASQTSSPPAPRAGGPAPASSAASQNASAPHTNSPAQGSASHSSTTSGTGNGPTPHGAPAQGNTGGPGSSTPPAHNAPSSGTPSTHNAPPPGNAGSGAPPTHNAPSHGSSGPNNGTPAPHNAPAQGNTGGPGNSPTTHNAPAQGNTAGSGNGAPAGHNTPSPQGLGGPGNGTPPHANGPTQAGSPAPTGNSAGNVQATHGAPAAHASNSPGAGGHVQATTDAPHSGRGNTGQPITASGPGHAPVDSSPADRGGSPGAPMAQTPAGGGPSGSRANDGPGTGHGQASPSSTGGFGQTAGGFGHSAEPPATRGSDPRAGAPRSEQPIDSTSPGAATGGFGMSPAGFGPSGQEPPRGPFAPQPGPSQPWNGGAPHPQQGFAPRQSPGYGPPPQAFHPGQAPRRQPPPRGPMPPQGRPLPPPQHPMRPPTPDQRSTMDHPGTGHPRSAHPYPPGSPMPPRREGANPYDRGTQQQPHRQPMPPEQRPAGPGSRPHPGSTRPSQPAPRQHQPNTPTQHHTGPPSDQHAPRHPESTANNIHGDTRARPGFTPQHQQPGTTARDTGIDGRRADHTPTSIPDSTTRDPRTPDQHEQTKAPAHQPTDDADRRTNQPASRESEHVQQTTESTAERDTRPSSEASHPDQHTPHREEARERVEDLGGSDRVADQARDGASDRRADHGGDDGRSAVDKALDPGPEPVRFDESYLHDPDYRAGPAENHAIRSLITEPDRADKLTETALRLRDRSPHMAGVSDAGAFALHSYTEHDVFDTVNRSMRLGPEDRTALFEADSLTNRAIVSAINELPPQELRMVRGIRSSQGMAGAHRIAAQYVEGRTTVEPALVSATIKLDDNDTSPFGDDVEIHIESRTARDIRDLSLKTAEREGITKPGTQWHTVSNRTVEVVENGRAREKIVIRVREVLPGDPEFLGPEDAAAELSHRRDLNRQEAARRDAIRTLVNNNSGTPTDRSSIQSILAGESDQPPAEHGPDAQEPETAHPADEHRTALSPLPDQHTPDDHPLRQPDTDPTQPPDRLTEPDHHDLGHPTGERTGPPDTDGAPTPDRPAETRTSHPAPRHQNQLHANLDHPADHGDGQASHPTPDRVSAQPALPDHTRTGHPGIGPEHPGGRTDQPAPNHVGRTSSEPGLPDHTRTGQSAAGLDHPRDGQPSHPVPGHRHRAGADPDLPDRTRAGQSDTGRPSDRVGGERTGQQAADHHSHVGTEPGPSDLTRTDRSAAGPDRRPGGDGTSRPTPGHQVGAEHGRPDHRPGSTDRPQTSHPDASGTRTGTEPRQAAPPRHPGQAPGQPERHAHSGDHQVWQDAHHLAADGHTQPVRTHEMAAGERQGGRDWSRLSWATRPPYEAAIHAGTANPRTAAHYMAEQHAALAALNPHYYHKYGHENGFRTNCTRVTVASALRHAGIEASAGPVLPKDLETLGTLEYVQRNLGGRWQEHPNFDTVIREMRGRQVGSRAVIAIEHRGSDGKIYKHVADVVHTRDGVAFVDGQSNTLMHLPPNAHRVRLLPYDLAEVARRHHERATFGADPYGHPGNASGHGFGAAPEPHRQTPSVEEVHHYLQRDDVQNAMERADAASKRDETAKIPVEVDGEIRRLHIGEAIAAMLPRHPELLGTIQALPFLEESILQRPIALANVLRHQEAIDILGACVDEVLHHPGGAEALVDHFDSLDAPFAAVLTPEQHAVADLAEQRAANVPTDSNLQSDYDGSRHGDDEYKKAYIDGLFENWRQKQDMLHALADAVAQEADGEAHSRTSEKSRVRAWDKATAEGKTPADLNDLIGSKVQFHSMADAYRGLGTLLDIAGQAESPYDIVSFEDRFQNPQDSGYRDLQLGIRVRLPDGTTHVGELRLHLHKIDDVAHYEHALYEIRRDIKAMAKDRPDKTMTPQEKALFNSIRQRERELFGAAYKAAGGTTEGDA